MEETTSLISLGQFGERARTIRAQLDETALIVGLGYVGLHAIAQTRVMLNTLLTRRDIQANVRLLAIARRRTIREEQIVPREERLSLDMEAINWSDVPGRYAQLGVAQWWPHSPRAREVQEDPWQVRAYSRLLLFHNAALVSDALYKLAQWLNETGMGRDADMPRHIYVLASLAEAESSGMLFDVLVRLRHLTHARPTAITGIFSMRAHPAENDPDNILAMANAYATLREMDSYTLRPDTFDSSLPVIGHSMTRSRGHPALDMIMLTDDAAQPATEAPESALAEAVTNLLAYRLLPLDQRPAIFEPVTHDPGTDRFAGYSTFGVAKMALPTRAAMNLASVGLGIAALKALKTTHTATSAASWIEQVISAGRAAVLDAEIVRSADFAERVREWRHSMSAAGLTRLLEGRTGRGEAVRMHELAQSEWRRLEREGYGQNNFDPTGASPQTDSLRGRADTILGVNVRDLRATLVASPVELALARGYGLIWTMSALDGLAQQMQSMQRQIERQADEAKAALEIARSALFDAAHQYDARSGGRRKPNPADLDTHARATLDALADLVAAEARGFAWRTLIELAHALSGQVRDALPQLEPSIQALREFELESRQAMESVVGAAPQLPAAVALSEQWYVQGVQNLSNMGQLPPRELLAQVFASWGHPRDLNPERQLYLFIRGVHDAARRTLAGVFQFSDLYEFLEQNQQNPLFAQTLANLPGAATPALIPTVDDKHPPPDRYELVREAPRPFSALGPSQGGVARVALHSPDPDEITVMRVLHGVMAEAIPALRESYRRAYDRAGAEGMPLHVDRRWDATMADLVHTSARREISLIWENLLVALHRNPVAVDQALDALVRALGVALDVQETSYAPTAAPDMRLITYKLRPFRLKLPPPTCAVLFVYSTRNADELAEEAFRAITPLPLEEQFAFVVNVANRPDIDQIVETLRRVDFTILVLDEADVKHLVGARLPTRALHDMVLSQVSLTTVSPFYTRGPVPEHMFFGREREIAEVRSKLRTHSVALIGGRRIGKTSTLQRIQRLLKPLESEYVPYYLDCHGATQYQSFFWLINRRWQVDISQDANPVEFEDVITVLQQRHPRKGIVLLFDEVDSLLEFDRQPANQETLFRTLRSLSNEKRCQYVFSGEKWLMRAIANPYSALFNFAQAVRLEPLPPKVVRHLVVDPFEMLNIWVEDIDQVLQRIYQISAGHPNIVQMICQVMVEELDRDPNNSNLLNYEHLDQATAQRTLQEQIVQTIWGQMNLLARMITLTWPEGTRYLTLNEIERLLNEAGITRIQPKQLERTARDLELYCFVRPRENDRLELIPMAFPAILDFMTDKRRQIEIVRQEYEADPEGVIT